MVERTALAVALTLTAVSIDAQAEDCDAGFSPERPGATNGHATTPRGCALIESAVTVQRDPSDTIVGVPLLLRVGVADPVEIRGAISVVNVTAPDSGETDVTAPPAALEVKITGLDAADHVPGLGVLFGLASVTNSDFTSQLTPSTSLLFDWELVDGFWLSANGIVSAPPIVVDERVLELRYAAVAWYSATSWLSVYANAFGGAPIRDGDFSQWVGGGFAFHVSGGVQLDLEADVEATGEHPVLVQTGIAFTF